MVTWLSHNLSLLLLGPNHVGSAIIRLSLQNPGIWRCLHMCIHCLFGKFMIWVSLESKFYHISPFSHTPPLPFLEGPTGVCTCNDMVIYDIDIIRKQFLSTFPWQWWHHVPLPFLVIIQYEHHCKAFFEYFHMAIMASCSIAFLVIRYGNHLKIISCLLKFSIMIQVWPWSHEFSPFCQDCLVFF